MWVAMVLALGVLQDYSVNVTCPKQIWTILLLSPNSRRPKPRTVNATGRKIPIALPKATTGSVTTLIADRRKQWWPCC